VRAGEEMIRASSKPLPRTVCLFKVADDVGGWTGVVGLVAQPPRADSVTAPPIMRHVAIWEGNRRGCHRGSWAWNWWDATLWCADKWRPGPNFKGPSFERPGAEWRLCDSSELVWH
jgi:hypothetical protein